MWLRYGRESLRDLSVIGKKPRSPTEDTETASALSGIRRWPVVISYFNEAATDAPPEYTLSFDLYENGVREVLSSITAHSPCAQSSKA